MHTTPEQRRKLQRQRREMNTPKPLNQFEAITDQAMQDEIIDIDFACQMLGCSKRTLWRKVSEGLLPPPMGMGKKSHWPYNTVLSVRESFRRNKKTVHAERVRDNHGRFTLKESQNGNRLETKPNV